MSIRGVEKPYNHCSAVHDIFSFVHRDADKRAAALAKKQAQAAADGHEHEADSNKIAEDIRAAEHHKSGGENSSKPPAVHHKKKVKNNKPSM